MKNIILNFFKMNFFFIIIKKFFKRFEKNTSREAGIWAKLNVKYTTEEFCRVVDSKLYDEILVDIFLIEKEAKKKLSKLNISLGGGGNYTLLYFLVRKFKPKIVVETGVAAGWSSLAILRALANNFEGNCILATFHILG